MIWRGRSPRASRPGPGENFFFFPAAGAEPADPPGVLHRVVSSLVPLQMQPRSQASGAITSSPNTTQGGGDQAHAQPDRQQGALGRTALQTCFIAAEAEARCPKANTASRCQFWVYQPSRPFVEPAGFSGRHRSRRSSDQGSEGGGAPSPTSTI